jgi:hypothetical protein
VNTEAKEAPVAKNTKKPSALEFALLIDTVPELTEQHVTAAYLAATEAWQNRDDIEEPETHGDIVTTLAEVPPTVTDHVGEHFAAPVEGRQIVTPVEGANAGSLALAVDKFVGFTGRLPHLGTREDRQAVMNLISGTRVEATPTTDCAQAHAQRAGVR